MIFYAFSVFHYHREYFRSFSRVLMIYGHFLRETNLNQLTSDSSHWHFLTQQGVFSGLGLARRAYRDIRQQWRKCGRLGRWSLGLEEFPLGNSPFPREESTQNMFWSYLRQTQADPRIPLEVGVGSFQLLQLAQVGTQETAPQGVPTTQMPNGWRHLATYDSLWMKVWWVQSTF